jgi:hypothetical protein
MIWVRRAASYPVLALSAVLVGGCSDVCQNAVIDRVRSPEGDFEAVLFQRDCGATAGFSTQVSILAVGEALDGSGNAFVADDDHGKAATGSWGGSWADIRWLSSDTLLVRYAEKSRIFEQDPSVSGVAIQFEPVPPQAVGLS